MSVLSSKFHKNKVYREQIRRVAKALESEFAQRIQDGIYEEVQVGNMDVNLGLPNHRFVEQMDRVERDVTLLVCNRLSSEVS